MMFTTAHLKWLHSTTSVLVLARLCTLMWSRSVLLWNSVPLLNVSVIRNVTDPFSLGTDHDGQLPVIATAWYSSREYLFDGWSRFRALASANRMSTWWPTA